MSTDPFRQRAAVALGIAPEEVTDEQRLVAKRVMFREAYSGPGLSSEEFVLDWHRGPGKSTARRALLKEMFRERETETVATEVPEARIGKHAQARRERWLARKRRARR